MKPITGKLREALNDNGTLTTTIELTPERKERCIRISLELIDELKKRTRSPFEAYMVLHFIMEAMQEEFGISGGVIVEEGGNA